jgi:hypothetical protein
MNTELVPINPCIECKWDEKDCPNDNECMSYRSYVDKKDAQKVLLKYLDDANDLKDLEKRLQKLRAKIL